MSRSATVSPESTIAKQYAKVIPNVSSSKPQEGSGLGPHGSHEDRKAQSMAQVVEPLAACSKREASSNSSHSCTEFQEADCQVMNEILGSVKAFPADLALDFSILTELCWGFCKQNHILVYMISEQEQMDRYTRPFLC